VECFKGAGANLALMARYAASPLLGTDQGQYVELDRPPTRFLVLTDAEERYATPQDRREQRRYLIAAIAWLLPTNLRPDLYDRGTRLVEILTWGRYPFEFAHFTDRQLANALLARAGKSHPRGRESLINAIKIQAPAARNRTSKRPGRTPASTSRPITLRQSAARTRIRTEPSRFRHGDHLALPAIARNWFNGHSEASASRRSLGCA
jgi:hypothetical protein